MIDYLKELREVVSGITKYKGVIIAGGAVYDTLDNNPIKDIDIFIGVETLHAHKEKVQLLVKSNLFQLDVTQPTLTDETYRQQFGNTLIGVTNFKYDGHRIQFIGLDIKPFNLQTLLETFDFNICKAGIDEYGMIETLERKFDVKYERLTLTKVSPETFVKTFQRYSRLKEKYPSHHLEFEFDVKVAASGDRNPFLEWHA